MRAKVQAIFIGKVENSFEDSDGKLVEYKQIAVNIPGEMGTNILSVPKEMEFTNLVPYQPCFLIVDFNYNNQYRTYKARVIRIVADSEELNNVPLYYDEPETNGYLASMSAAAKARANAK